MAGDQPVVLAVGGAGVLTIVAALVLVVAAVGLAWWFRGDGVLRRRARSQWVVTLKDGTAFRGVLTDHDRRSIVLSDADHMGGDSRTPVDGEVVILLADVKYAQRL